LNGDGYSKIKQTVKENVKAILPDNKPLEVLTNEVINTAVASSSSNLILLLPQSSSTFPRPFNQSDTYRTAESESFHNNKGDIAD
jgi:hypothetical protein